MRSQSFYSVFVDPLRMFPEKRIFHMILRFRMHRHSYSNLGAICAKYIWQTRKWLFFFHVCTEEKDFQRKSLQKEQSHSIFELFWPRTKKPKNTKIEKKLS